jgi:hypothetical protein
MKMHLISFALWCGLAICSRLQAGQLVFDQPQVEIALPVDSQEGRATFPFRNTSPAAVRILEVKTECDCIQASLPTRVIGPGQTGEIVLKFRPKPRNGTELLHAQVIADNGETHDISVNVTSRSYIDVRPLTLQWRKGEKRDTREFIVSSSGLAKLQFSRVTAIKGSKVEIVRGDDPTSIRVSVTAPAPDGPFQDTLVVSAVLADTGETRIYDLHVRGE